MDKRNMPAPNGSELYDEAYYSRATSSTPAERQRERGVLDFWASTLFARFQPKAVLDVGCGLGGLVSSFSRLGCRAVGMDLSRFAVARCVRQEQGQFVLADAEQGWPFVSGEFDLVTAIQVVEHLKDVENFVGEAYRVLNKGGGVFIATVSPPPSVLGNLLYKLICIVTGRHGITGHFTERPRSWWVAYFTKRGFFLEEDFKTRAIALRIKHGYDRLTMPEKVLFRLGRPGRFFVAYLRNLFAARLLFKKSS